MRSVHVSSVHALFVVHIADVDARKKSVCVVCRISVCQQSDRWIEHVDSSVLSRVAT